jgi:hypothetical protein
MGHINPAAAHLPRHQRRSILKEEERRRACGDWGPWELLSFPRGSACRGWAAEFVRAHRNAVFSVLDRHVGPVRHLAIASLSQIRPTWPEMQRIKNELAGADATAVEVYPPQLEVVDEAPMYHLWVLPQPLEFGLWHVRADDAADAAE